MSRIAQVDLVYTGRSGKFKHGKIYKTSLDVSSRDGTKSPDLWIYTIRTGWFKTYRITPYEFTRYWKHADPRVLMPILLKIMYRCDDYMRDLVYKDNPFLSMLKAGPWQGAYLPVPIVYSTGQVIDVSTVNDYQVTTIKKEDLT
jgi:hypothetical protein